MQTTSIVNEIMPLIRGWLYGGEAKARPDKVWRDGDQIWFVPPPYRSIEELHEIVENKRARSIAGPVDDLLPEAIRLA